MRYNLEPEVRAAMINLRRSRNTKEDPAYKSWKNMMARYSDEVILPWKMYATFYKDMGPKPLNSKLIRLNPSKNFSSGNCKWL